MHSSTQSGPAPGATIDRIARVALALAALVGWAARTSGDAVDSPDFSLHGFGTLGAVRSDQNEADVVSSVFLQPNGPGHTSTWHTGVDSKIGGQLDARFSAKLSAVLQVVSKHRYDNSWTPEIEWANVKYQLAPGLSVRAGRTVAPMFMLSDTANIGYANPWIRGPQEIYGMVPITHLDGIDLAWNVDAGSVMNSFHASFGRDEFKAVGGDKITGKNIWIVSNTVEYAGVALRVGYLRADIIFDSSGLDSLIHGLSDLGDGLSMSGFATAGGRAHTLASRYNIDDTPVEVFTVGARMDPGNWLFIGEWAHLTDLGILPQTEAWYVTGGYHFHKVTPYITFAEVNAKTPAEPGIPLGGLPPGPLADGAGGLNAALNSALGAAAPSQQSFTLGLRWDVMDTAALKVEYQHIRLDDLSAGRFGNVQPRFTPGGNADVFSIAVDFVF